MATYKPFPSKIPAPVRQQTPQEQVHDVINSKLSVAVYHRNAWQQGQLKRNATYHAMKYLTETVEYHNAPFDVELGRIVRIVKSKKEKFSDNPINCIVCYYNDNQGRTLPGVINRELFRVTINTIITGYEMNPNLDEQAQEFIMYILHQINEALQ